jgi:hypothetical protein
LPDGAAGVFVAAVAAGLDVGVAEGAAGDDGEPGAVEVDGVVVGAESVDFARLLRAASRESVR